MTTRMRKNLSWLAVIGSFVCSIILRFSALAAAHHATSAAAVEPQMPKSAEIGAFRK
jgi:hypothetical protein